MSLNVSVVKSLVNIDIQVSFTVKPGELKVITGPSGAGKSTLIRMIAGLERPGAGVIALNGRTWVDTARNIFVRPQKRKVGYVFQDYTLFPHLTVRKNVAFASRKNEEEEIERLLTRFGIRHLRDRMPHEISGGERQRCAICQNLVRKPDLLLLDEPFSALDVENRRKLRREIKDLKGRLAIPVIHVTHDLHEALVLGADAGAKKDC